MKILNEPQDQISRKSNINIFNVPESDVENDVKLVFEIFSQTNISVPTSDIVRPGNAGPKQSPINVCTNKSDIEILSSQSPKCA